MAPPKRLDHLQQTAGIERQTTVYDAVIERNEVINAAGTVRQLQLRVLNDTTDKSSGAEHFSYKAGQWVDFSAAAHGEPVVGGYSIVSAPRMSADLTAAAGMAPLPRFDLAVRVARHPTAAWVFSHAERGKVVQVRVGGSFYLARMDIDLESAGSRSPSRYSHVLLVAGGVGINPLFSMLLELASHAQGAGNNGKQREAVPDVTLLYSVRDAADALFLDRLVQIQRLCFASSSDGRPSPRLRLHLAVTRGAGSSGAHATEAAAAAQEAVQQLVASNPDWVSLSEGRVTEQLLRRLLDTAGARREAQQQQPSAGGDCSAVIVCGPPSMTDAVVGMCEQAGVAAHDIHFEKWW